MSWYHSLSHTYHRTPEQFECLTTDCTRTAVNGLYCRPCDQAILAAVRKGMEPLRTSANTPNQPR